MGCLPDLLRLTGPLAALLLFCSGLIFGVLCLVAAAVRAPPSRKPSDKAVLPVLLLPGCPLPYVSLYLALDLEAFSWPCQRWRGAVHTKVDKS